MKTPVKALFLICLVLLSATACLPLTGKSFSWYSRENSSPQQTQQWDPVIIELEKLNGRVAGSQDEKKAATLLARKFAALNLDPLLAKNNFYFQPFPIPQRTSYYESGRLKFKGVGEAKKTSQNVVGILPGRSDKILILSAHYDGQGVNNKKVYPSANDNLSGIAALLELANSLRTRSNRNLNYVFVAFGAEEMGLLGSHYFVQNLPFAKDKIMGLINLDTIGNGSGKMLLHATSPSSLVNLVQAKLQNYDFEVSTQIGPKRISDHYPFGIAGIPSLSILDFEWLKENHTPADTLDKVDLDQVMLVVKAIEDAVLSLDESLN